MRMGGGGTRAARDKDATRSAVKRLQLCTPQRPPLALLSREHARTPIVTNSSEESGDQHELAHRMLLLLVWGGSL
jgi:hypothetical protein